MNTLKLSAKHEGTVIDQILNVKSQIEYHNVNTAPFYSEMEAWEMKEYKSVNEDSILKLAELKKYIIENESTFNDLLSNYNLSVAVFLNKYIN